MSDDRTTAVIERYLVELADDERVQRLIEEILESGSSVEQVCERRPC